MILTIYYASMLVMALSGLLVLIRAWRGPSILDRVVALETLALIVVGFLLLAAYTPIGRLYSDAALGLALLSFVSTVLLAFFLGRGEYGDE